MNYYHSTETAPLTDIFRWRPDPGRVGGGGCGYSRNSDAGGCKDVLGGLKFGFSERDFVFFLE